MKYQVLVQHFGDKQYMAGDVREVANDKDAHELIAMGLIAPMQDKVNEPVDNQEADPVEVAQDAPMQDKVAKKPTTKAK